jgi:hypothetical protein
MNEVKNKPQGSKNCCKSIERCGRITRVVHTQKGGEGNPPFSSPFLFAFFSFISNTLTTKASLSDGDSTRLFCRGIQKNGKLTSTHMHMGGEGSLGLSSPFLSAIVSFIVSFFSSTKASLSNCDSTRLLHYKYLTDVNRISDNIFKYYLRTLIISYGLAELHHSNTTYRAYTRNKSRGRESSSLSRLFSFPVEVWEVLLHENLSKSTFALIEDYKKAGDQDSNRQLTEVTRMFCHLNYARFRSLVGGGGIRTHVYGLRSHIPGLSVTPPS